MHKVGYLHVVAVPVDPKPSLQPGKLIMDFESLVICSHCHSDLRGGHDFPGAGERAAATNAEG